MGQISNLRAELSYWRTYAVVMTTIAFVLAGSAVMLAFEVLRLRDVIGGVL